MINPVPQLETQVDSSANLPSAGNVLSISPIEDTSKVEHVKMLSESDDTKEKTYTTTIDSTEKSDATIITDGDHRAQENLEVDKSPELELGLITIPLDIPDVWPELNELWTDGTTCNKLPDYKSLYWDWSYIIFHYGKPIVCGVLIDDRVDNHMLTTLYGPNPAQSDWCKSMTMWLDKDQIFLTYRVRTPGFYPNIHMS